MVKFQFRNWNHGTGKGLEPVWNWNRGIGKGLEPVWSRFQRYNPNDGERKRSEQNMGVMREKEEKIEVVKKIFFTFLLPNLMND